jgi:hypothetical protein
MLDFSLKDKSVKISISIKTPSGERRTFWTYWPANDSWAADFLADAMRTQFENAVRAARAEAYARGFRDAKQKRRKETWFSCWL